MCQDCKHILFVCNTYMQLLTAIQIKISFFENSSVDIVLTDHSVEADLVCKRLTETGIVNRVHFAYTKKICYGQNLTEDVKDVFRLTFNWGDKFKRFLWNIDKKYDLIFYYNIINPLCITAYDESIRSGKEPKCVCFEEGILTYQNMVLTKVKGRWYCISMLRKILGKDIYKKTIDYYCYYPELFPIELINEKCHKIPVLDRNNVRVRSMMNTIFNYHPETDQYPQRYIFFSSSSDIDGNHTGETELVIEIANIVGKENLLVKMHPRDHRHIYEDYEIAVSRNSHIPWEVVQLNHDFSEHIFLTLSSGSVLNASVMLGDEIETKYLYPLARKNNEQFYQLNDRIIGSTLDKLRKIGKCKSFTIVSEGLDNALKAKEGIISNEISNKS